MITNDKQIESKFYEIMNAFKRNGGRITEQRKNLIRLILNNPTCSCKELFYLANVFDRGIGRATVYRTVQSLEEMGFISRRSICFN